MESEVVDALLLHDRVNLLEKVPEVEWIKFRKLVKLLMRNYDQLCLSLPVEIDVCETPLVIQMSAGCKLLLTGGAVSLVVTSLVVTRVTRRVDRLQGHGFRYCSYTVRSF